MILVVLAIWEAQELQEVVDELWLTLAKGKNFCYIAAHEFVHCMDSLPVFYEFIGCNTVSAFRGHGKKTAWAISKR